MYFPKSQIVTNLFTNGNEFTYLRDNSSYSGYYWSTSNGKFFTGKTPEDSPTLELKKIISTEEYEQKYSSNKSIFIALPYDSPNENIIENNPYNQNEIIKYSNLLQIDLNNLPTQQLPTYSPTLPTEEDYKIGEFERYFCVKRNQNIYLEIKKDIYNKLSSQNNQIAWQLYKPFKLSWAITGVRDDVFLTNKNIVALTSQRNQLVGFNLYLKEDYLKYYNG